MIKKLYILFKVVVIFNLLVCLVNGELTATFICLFNLVLLYIADYIQMKIKYSSFLQLLIYIFLIGSLVGGEVYHLYSKIWFLDIILHVLSSFIVSGLFLSLFKLFKCSCKKFLIIIGIFSFAMMIASLWEIAEFSIDRIFDVDMQKDTVIFEVNSSLLSFDGKSIVKNRINNMTIGGRTINGYLDVGLYDTIEDMVCAIFGSFLFIILNRNKLKKVSLV